MGASQTILSEQFSAKHGKELDPAIFQILDFDLQHGALHLDRTNEEMKVSEEELFARVEANIHAMVREIDLSLEECRVPAMVLYKYSKLTEEEKTAFTESVLAAAIASDKTHRKPANPANYDKSFGGTEADSKNEKEAAAMLRGETSTKNNDNLGILTQPIMAHPSEHTALRQAGKWMKFLSVSGCYLYIHNLTRDMVAVKPDEFIEEATNEGESQNTEEQQDPAYGYQKIPLTALLETVEHIVTVMHKTPLIIDTSPSEAVRTFYSYKGHVADLSALTIPYGKSGVKMEDIMERGRKVLVAALKNGETFVAYLGGLTSQHVELKTKLCKKDTFPKEVFIHGGHKLFEPDYDPAYKHIYREEDLEGGVAVFRDVMGKSDHASGSTSNKGFCTVVVTSLSPQGGEMQRLLEDCVPLGYMHPVFVELA